VFWYWGCCYVGANLVPHFMQEYAPIDFNSMLICALSVNGA
jgi:hypothetical protein